MQHAPAPGHWHDGAFSRRCLSRCAPGPELQAIQERRHQEPFPGNDGSSAALLVALVESFARAVAHPRSERTVTIEFKLERSPHAPGEGLEEALQGACGGVAAVISALN
jgi:hypothetical protein